MARSARSSSNSTKWRAKARTNGVKATDHAYTELKRAIEGNALRGGRNYLQQDIAENLRISRTPSREAIIRLACEGLVDIEPRHGIRVRLLTLDDINEIHDCLAALEGHAVRRIAQQGVSPPGLAELTAAQATMERAAAQGDLALWVTGDRAFHNAIIAACGNNQLQRAAALHWDRLSRVRVRLAGLRPSPAVSIREHAAILGAIRRGDAEKAYELHVRHHARAADVFTAQLSREGVAEL